MQKVTILSSTHIGNGEKYPNYLIINSNRYAFDDIISVTFHRNKQQLLSANFIDKIKSFSQNKSGEAKREIANLLTPTASEIDKIKPQYRVTLSTPKTNQLDINDHIKNLDKVILPGSSLKGYLVNVMVFDIIKKNGVIRKYYEDNLKNNKRLVENVERNVFMVTLQKLMCRDIIFDDAPEIKLISRITKSGNIPNMFECMKPGSICVGDFVSKIKTHSNINSLTGIELIYAEELETRISTIYDNFAEMNKQFVLNALKYEKEFIDQLKNRDDVDKSEIYKQINLIEKELNAGKIIIQLGKNTNYIVKSSGHAFERDFYIQYFSDIFYPGFNNRGEDNRLAKPFNIGSMNLVSISDFEGYNEIPGFVEIQW